MTKLKDKIENALNESRTLILGAEVLLGFQYQSFFQTGFEKLPAYAQQLEIVNLALMLVVVGLLIAPAAYHRLVANGEDTEDVNRCVTGVMGMALLPFALAMGSNFLIAVEKAIALSAGLIAGIAALLVAIFFWYGFEMIGRSRHSAEIERIKSMADKNEKPEPDGNPLPAKIKQVLTETRIVLPGVQALLGFQLAVMLMDSFDKLTPMQKYTHLEGLGWIALSMVLLMTPAAYHRIVEQGEETERFLRLASRLVLFGMAFLALGIASDFYVVADKVFKSHAFAIALAAIAIVFFYGLWFGYTAIRRNQLSSQQERMG